MSDRMYTSLLTVTTKLFTLSHALDKHQQVAFAST
jgi:hypothetical protein